MHAGGCWEEVELFGILNTKLRIECSTKAYCALSTPFSLPLYRQCLTLISSSTANRNVANYIERFLFFFIIDFFFYFSFSIWIFHASFPSMYYLFNPFFLYSLHPFKNWQQFYRQKYIKKQYIYMHINIHISIYRFFLLGFLVSWEKVSAIQV